MKIRKNGVSCEKLSRAWTTDGNKKTRKVINKYTQKGKER
jgi:hypothetical protein